MSHRPSGVAFKVTYNDGGAESVGGVGYRGTCSDATMLINVRRRTNCSDGTRCAEHVARGLKPGARPRSGGTKSTSWCNEAVLLCQPRWSFSAGVYHHGPRRGEIIPMDRGVPGDIVFLTTRFPGQAEAERSIFAVYRVGERRTVDWGVELVSDGTMQVQLPDILAGRFPYWRYASSANGPDWRTGLFRYLDEEATARIVSELSFMLGDRDERDELVAALGTLAAPRPPESGGVALPRFPTGEGDAHRRLKERVAAHPELIGLPRRAKPTIEHAFMSGDRVDVAFSLPDGRHAVVEIETVVPYPGAHQCIKYRALMEAQIGAPLGSGRVHAVLVAHLFDEETRALASRYGIQLVALRA